MESIKTRHYTSYCLTLKLKNDYFLTFSSAYIYIHIEVYTYYIHVDE